MSIQIPDMLNLVADQTPFELLTRDNDPNATKGFRLPSQAPLPDSSDPFVGLSSSEEILDAYEKYSEAFKRGDAGETNPHVGKYVTMKDTFRLNMASFKLGDSKLPLESARHPILTPEFLYPVKPKTLATSVCDMDLARLEKQQRETLAVLSNCDAVVAALTTVCTRLL